MSDIKDAAVAVSLVGGILWLLNQSGAASSPSSAQTSSQVQPLSPASRTPSPPGSCSASSTVTPPPSVQITPPIPPPAPTPGPPPKVTIISPPQISLPQAAQIQAQINNGLTPAGYTPQAQAALNNLQSEVAAANASGQNLLTPGTGIGSQTNTPVFTLTASGQSGYYGGIYNTYLNGLYYTQDQPLGAPTPEIGNGGLRNTNIPVTAAQRATIIAQDPLHLQ